jgi:hypothetical protein
VGAGDDDRVTDDCRSGSSQIHIPPAIAAARRIDAFERRRGEQALEIPRTARAESPTQQVARFGISLGTGQRLHDRADEPRIVPVHADFEANDTSPPEAAAVGENA